MTAIPCKTVGCNCPEAPRSKPTYTFTYICNDRNIVYYDVPKAGSTTIRDILFPRAWPNGKAPCFNSIREKRQINKNYFTFTIVRNPYSRMVSLWKHFIGRDYHIKQLRRSGVSLDECKSFPEFIYMTRKLCNHHWQPQTKFVPEDVNYIGKLESFQESFDHICSLVNLNKMHLPKVNNTQHEHYTTYYNDELIGIVTELYAADLERFNYTYGD